MKVSKKIVAALGIVTVTAAGVGLHASGASAAGPSYQLSPVPGAVSFGGGSVTLNGGGVSMPIGVDLNGARGFTTYRVYACSGIGAGASCSIANSATVATDINGSIHTTVVVQPPVLTNEVLVSNVGDGNDSYQAIIGSVASAVQSAGYATVSPYVVNGYAYGLPYGYTVANANTVAGTVGNAVMVRPGTGGVVFVPATATVAPGYVCPAGYHGPLSVVVGGSNFGYRYWNFYQAGSFPFTNLPFAALSTVTVFC